MGIKPRHAVAPFTEEDWWVLIHVRDRLAEVSRGRWLSWVDLIEESDRRDADLMLSIAMNRHLGTDCEPGDQGYSLKALVLDMAQVRYP